MKVNTLMDFLSKMNPEDDICALVYDKSWFEFEEDGALVLTKEAWEKTVNEFDEMPFRDVYQFIFDSALDNAEYREVTDKYLESK